ncbi:MAG: asparagine synthase (glutamine-hydrolyzing) [Candidatus Liptonbacteria bacterium]|nr:asparagine synthase (glutamine-hydrolyzing) [Candidatus Liptonbacteria bacterium]
MCGISGIYSVELKEYELKSAVTRMNAIQKRRGPDDEGFFLSAEDGLAISHTRLSILDLSSAGKQPMRYQCKVSGVRRQVSITFNGEIYNFLELRKELERKGHQFQTKTDTEVILAAYVEWGAESFKKLRGMFAFGLWDEGRRKLFLVKDRYGIKPLYYYCDKENLVFASTVKAIKQSGLVTANKNEQALIGFLLFGSVPLPRTTLEGVCGLEAGYYLEVSKDLSVKKVKYYEPLDYFNKTREQENIKTQEQIIARTRELLEESVRLHMISDAPLGVFLSGGVDSSVLAILASKARKNPITTLSITFDEAEFSEKKYQDLIAKQIGSNHHEYKITRQDFEDATSDIFEAMDEPTIDGVNTYFVAEAAKKAGLKTVLSGLGADEIFFGYNHFRRAALLRKMQNGLSIFGHHKSAGLTMSRTLGFFSDKYAKLGYLCQNDLLRFYLAIRGLFVPAEVAKILDISVKEVNDLIDSISETYKLINLQTYKLAPADALSYLELKFYLQNQLLKDSDFMAMHHSIEIRVPFLDNLLVEYVSSLPAEIKLNIGKSDPSNIDSGTGRSDFQKLNKPLLIAAMKDVLPEAIWDRPKMGFTLPFSKWLKEIAISDTLPGKIKKLFLKNKIHWSRAWALVFIKNRAWRETNDL